MSTLENEEWAWLDEEVKAAGRLGKTPEQVMRWVLRFVQMDLSGLSEGQWSDLGAEAHVFTKKGPPLRIGRVTSYVAAVFDWGGGSPEKDLPKKGKTVLTIRPSREQITELQHLTRGIFESLAAKEPILFELGPLSLYVNPVSYSVKHGGLTIKVHGPFDAFGLHVAFLLAQHPGRLRRCAECQTLFLAERSNQQFCITRCLTRVTQRRWRERHRKKTAGKGTKPPKHKAVMKRGAHRGKKAR